MLKNILLITLTLFNLYFFPQNFVATYSFANVTAATGITDPSPVPVVNGLTFSSFFAVGTSSNSTASGRFSFTDWPTGALNSNNTYSSYTGAFSGLDYYEVSINVAPSYTLSLSSITFYVRRSATGIRNYSVRSNQDNFNSNLTANTGTNAKLSVLPGNIFFWNYDSVSTASDQKGSSILLGTQFSNITGPLIFRFYAWNSELVSGSFSIDNVSFTGAVTDTVILPDPVGVINSSPNLLHQIKVYPDPNSDGLINVQSNALISNVEVINMMGERVLTKQINNSECKLDISSQPSGTYLVKVYSGNRATTKKLILSR